MKACIEKASGRLTGVVFVHVQQAEYAIALFMDGSYRILDYESFEAEFMLLLDRNKETGNLRWESEHSSVEDIVAAVRVEV